MTINEFSKEILSIMEQYLKLKQIPPTEKELSENLTRSDLLHICLASVWKELSAEQKNMLVFNAKYATITSYICEMNRMLLFYYCSKNYAKEALNISNEIWNMEHDNAESLANN